MNTGINTPGTVTIGGDLTVGNVGYGAMQLTGPKVWGEYPDHDKGVALLREVVAEGVTFIDTADVYGPHSNEELIKEALHPYPDNLVIASKGGFFRGGPEYSDMGATGNKWYLRQAAYMSMRRLGVEQIDLYYLHTPAFTDTPFEDAVETLAWMKPTAVLVNTSRGPVVDQAALAAALQDGTIWAAGLDVTDPEPIPMDDPLVGLDNCLIVPHIASASRATRGKMAAMAAANLVAGVRGEPLPTEVPAPA